MKRAMTMALFGVVTAAPTAPAQQPKPEATRLREVSVSATRTENPVDELPVTVRTISAEEIDRDLAQDVKDLIRYEPGISVRAQPSRFTAAGASTGRGGNEGFTIRGLEGNQVLIQVDGIRLPNAFSFGPANFGRGDLIDLEAMKSVEILRGPASTLYGSDGLAGAVTFVTRDPADLLSVLGKDTYAAWRGAYTGADRAWSNTFSGAWRAGRLEGLVLFTRRDGRETDNKGANPALNVNRDTPNPQDLGSDYLLGKLVFKSDARNRWRLTVESLDRRIDTDGITARAAPLLGATSVLGLLAYDRITRERVSLDHQWTNAAATWFQRAHWSLYYQDSTQRQLAFEDRNTAVDRVRDTRYRQSILGAQLQLESNFRALGGEHRLSWGADLSSSRYAGLRDGLVPPAGETFPQKPFPDTDYRLFGAYAQDEIVWGRWSLIPGLRLDGYKLVPEPSALFPSGAPAGQSDAAFSPKLGALYRLAPAANLFAQYAHGFRAPTSDQVNNGFTNLVSGYRSIGNPNLKPERSNTVEAGVRGAGGAGSTLRYSLSIFDGRYKDFISQQQISGVFGNPANPAIFQFVNFSRVRIHGAEARGEWGLPHGWTASGAIAYAKGDSTSTAGVTTALDTVDPLKTVLGLRYDAPGKAWGANLRGTLLKAKEADRVSAATLFRSPSAAVLDLTAYWNLGRHATLSAGIFNLTDRKYWIWADVRGLLASSNVRDAFTQPGRNTSISLKLQF